MSELNTSQNNRAKFHISLMATASAVALTACVASNDAALAQDSDRPTVWIELGGQMELMQGVTSPFIAPFMTAISPVPGPYSGDIFHSGQKPPRDAFGLEGELSFQPENSDWVFTAGIRYGRAHAKRHIHNQTQLPPYHITIGSNRATRIKYPAPFADTKSDSHESHAILDFEVGKDVGLGVFGHDGTSALNAGVRFAQFSFRSSLDAQARPVLVPHPFAFLPSLPQFFTWDQYALTGHADRSFHGVGPSLSWNASAGLLGNRDDGELMIDWGINAGLLFGRQRASTDHSTQQRHFNGPYASPRYPVIYQTGTGIARSRSRSVAVPNIGGTIGLSVKYPNAKIALGYRADFFFGAVDAGIDQRQTKDLGFSGPFATISIGLGG